MPTRVKSEANVCIESSNDFYSYTYLQKYIWKQH